MLLLVVLGCSRNTHEIKQNWKNCTSWPLRNSPNLPGDHSYFREYHHELTLRDKKLRDSFSQRTFTLTLLVFYKVLAYLKKDLAENQDALLRATEEMGNNGKILEGWMKLNTNSSTFFPSSLLLVKMKTPMAIVRQKLPLWRLMLSNISCQEDISSPIFRL